MCWRCHGDEAGPCQASLDSELSVDLSEASKGCAKLSYG